MKNPIIKAAKKIYVNSVIEALEAATIIFEDELQARLLAACNPELLDVIDSIMEFGPHQFNWLSNQHNVILATCIAEAIKNGQQVPLGK